MLSLSACSRFWSSLRIVNFVSFSIPFGKNSSKFCDKWRSVRFSKPLTSSGISSSRFSDTSRQTRFLRLPISAGSRCSWLWSSHSSCSEGKLPRWGGSSSISLSPKSNRSSFVSLLIDSGRCLRRFSRNSSDSNCIKLWREKKHLRLLQHLMDKFQSTWRKIPNNQLSLIKKKIELMSCHVEGQYKERGCFVGSEFNFITPSYRHRNTRNKTFRFVNIHRGLCQHEAREESRINRGWGKSWHGDYCRFLFTLMAQFQCCFMSELVWGGIDIS